MADDKTRGDAAQDSSAPVPADECVLPTLPEPDDIKGPNGYVDVYFPCAVIDIQREAFEAGKRAAHQAAPAQPANLERQIIEKRIAITPEYEGGFRAQIYGDSDTAQHAGYGATPSEAIHAVQPVAPAQPSAVTIDADKIAWGNELQKRLMVADDQGDDDLHNLLGEAACFLAAVTGRPELGKVAVPTSDQQVIAAQRSTATEDKVICPSLGDLLMPKAQRDAVLARYAAPTSDQQAAPPQMLSNLLARIHRDGGHREAEIGTEAAVAEADLIVAKLNAGSDQQAGAVAKNIAAGLQGLANHIRACEAYKLLRGDMDIVDQAIAVLAAPAAIEQAGAQPDVRYDALILVRAAAKDMYNKTFAEKRLRMSSTDASVRDAAVAAGEVLVAALKATEFAAPTPATDQEDAMPATQEPKYGIKQNRLYNRASGEFIPADEPVFIFRARDKLAAAALEYYMHRCGDPAHQEAVFMRMADFDKFASNNPSRMKWPDTVAATPVTDQAATKQGE